MCSDGLSLVLRRDRVDKNSEETTFVSTDSIRLTGSMKFDVYDREIVFFRQFWRCPMVMVSLGNQTSTQSNGA